MKLLACSKDGGPKSTVTGYWLAEIKSLFSIVLLRFDDGSRDEYHDHAFDSVSWVLRGKLLEQLLGTSGAWPESREYEPSVRPVVTRRSTFHRVVSHGTTWVLSFRGPWSKTWHEYDPATDRYTTLGHGREVVS